MLAVEEPSRRCSAPYLRSHAGSRSWQHAHPTKLPPISRMFVYSGGKRGGTKSKIGEVNQLTTCIRDTLEWVVDGEHYRLDANLAHRTMQCRCREVARGGNKQLLAEIVTHQLVFAHRHIWEPATIKFMINAVDVVRAK